MAYPFPAVWSHEYIASCKWFKWFCELSNIFKCMEIEGVKRFGSRAERGNVSRIGVFILFVSI